MKDLADYTTEELEIELGHRKKGTEKLRQDITTAMKTFHPIWIKYSDRHGEISSRIINPQSWVNETSFYAHCIRS